MDLLLIGASTKIGAILDIEYIRLTYETIQEARYRMISVALKTYKFKCSMSIELMGYNIWHSMVLCRNIT